MAVNGKLIFLNDAVWARSGYNDWKFMEPNLLSSGFLNSDSVDIVFYRTLPHVNVRLYPRAANHFLAMVSHVAFCSRFQSLFRRFIVMLSPVVAVDFNLVTVVVIFVRFKTYFRFSDYLLGQC